MKRLNNKCKKLLRKQDGFTLIEVLVGIAIISIVFFSIFGVYQLAIRIVDRANSRITATSIASSQIESIRSLSYDNIGVSGNYPDGILEGFSTINKNNRDFIISTRVDYIVNPEDGVSGLSDECPNDYKRVEVRVSWDSRSPGEVLLSTDIAPGSLAEECSETGGVLSVSVFDAFGQLVESPLIEILDPITKEVLKSFNPFGGSYFFPLSTSTYEVIVSKDGYSLDKSYGINEVATPVNSNPLIMERELTEISFSIDRIGSFSVDTISPRSSEYFIDNFSDQSKISEFSNIDILLENTTLTKIGESYVTSGYLISNDIAPSNILSWDTLSFDYSSPINTDFNVQVFYSSSSESFLIPDGDLPGNSVGFTEEIDLSSLSPSLYPVLQIQGNFSTSNSSSTPILFDWQVSWTTNNPVPIGNISFNLRGNKTLGTDENEELVYKYSNDFSSDSSGHIDISNLEWDSYTFTIDPIEGLGLIGTNPETHPIDISPAEDLEIELYLDSENSLLATIKENITLDPVFSSSMRLYNSSLGYDETNYANSSGQIIFIPLYPATYNFEISAGGYDPISGTVFISGDETKIYTLERVE